MEQVFEKIKPKTYEMLYDLAKDPIFKNDFNKAKVALESVLHTFASRLDIDKGIIVISNLPPHLKVHFSRGWKPFKERILIPSDNFISNLRNKTELFFSSFTAEQIKEIIKKVFILLSKYIPSEKMMLIQSCFDCEIKNIIAS